MTLVAIIAGCSGSAPGSPSASLSSDVSPLSTRPSLPASFAPATSSPTARIAPATPSARAGLTSTTTPATAAPAGSLRVGLAGPPPHFEPHALTATAGDVDFFLTNSSFGTHTLAIGPALRDRIVGSRQVPSGQTAIFTVHGLRAGEYVIWCTIDNHADLGMVGTLTVK